MATYRELLARVKGEIDEVGAADARERQGEALFVDVRERDEWEEGVVPGAVHIPRGNLESRIEGLVPDRSREIVLYCSGGSRSAFAAKALQELGYENVSSLTGGFTDWKRNGFPVETPRSLSPDQRRRYSRHLLIPEVGEVGQERLLGGRVLLIGAGGLGSPASLYLAAAGVGTLGIVDADVVDDSNLQRQIVHSTDTLGEPKVESAKRTIQALNPDVVVKTYEERLTSENVERIFGEGWDVIVDGADNFPTRYLVNDASVWHGIPVVHGSIYRFEGQVTVFNPGEGPCYRCLFPTRYLVNDASVWHGIPVVHGSIYRFEGQVTVFNPGEGPCYRCLFPTPPPPELAPSCAEGGVLGVLPGIVGSLQANEALKLVLGIGDSLQGRLLLLDALGTTIDEVAVQRDPNCPVCGEHPTITEYVDYVEFCQGVRG
jgi:sulfur-carrier protein adenylyltransferase/sulfurtransferase